MSKFLRFNGATQDRTEVDAWFAARDPALADLARAWFVELWRALRPVFIGRGMVVPRIWNT